MLDCRIGPLRLRVQHTVAEWRVASEYEDEVLGAVPAVTLQVISGALPDDDITRYVAPRTGDRLRLKPLLPDRAVVVRPRQPVFLPSHGETTLYLSTPVWLQLEVGEQQPVTLCEVPALRLSDTWFGPSTQEGEFCYSDKTHARHALAEVPYRPHRVVTPVNIRNEAATTLPLEKLSLPIPVLSVYGAADGSLWTQGLTLVRRSDSDMAAIKVDAKPPAFAGEISLISGPRQFGRGGLVRVFSLLFGS